MRHFTYLIVFLFIFCNTNGQNRNSKNLQKGKIYNSEIKCTTKMRTNPDGGESIIIKTCKWHNYKFVVTGEPDYKGRYSYEYELFMIENGKEKKTNNSKLFNDKINQLEKLVNYKVRRILDDYGKDPENSECLKGEVFKNIEINEMGISFSEDGKIEFNVSLGLSDACFNIDIATVSFNLNEIDEYLRK
jgi:hypothetical protein